MLSLQSIVILIFDINFTIHKSEGVYFSEFKTYIFEHRDFEFLTCQKTLFLKAKDVCF